MTDKPKRTCKGCSRDISHKHPNAKFHSKKCKDTYWNQVNPRGLGLALLPLLEEEQERVDNFDGSWDAHQCYTVDDEERQERIHNIRRRMKK